LELKLIGKKVGMTQVFNSGGEVVPVTIIALEDGVVVEKKASEKEGYDAICVGFFDEKKPKNMTKPLKGKFKNDKKGLNIPLKKMLKEIKLSKEDTAKYDVGGSYKPAGLIKDGDFIDVMGISKGKGTQGVMKRHNFSGGVSTHGSMSHRAPGSIGSSTYPARVFKNMKMAGVMGNDRVIVQNLKVEKVDEENGFVLIRGAVPGGKNAVIEITRSIKKKGNKGDKK